MYDLSEADFYPPLSASFEPNDTLDTATLLGSGSYRVTDGTDVDWYQLVTGPGMMEFSLEHTGATNPTGWEMNLNLELRDDSGRTLRAAYRTNADESFSFLARPGETYYLKVSWGAYPNGAPEGTYLDYNLQVDLPVNTWATKLDFGPVRTASVAVYDIDYDGKDEIVVGTSKALDDQGREVRPAGLIVLEDDGTVKWTHTFAAIDGPDPITGLTYTSTSVSTQPVFSDVNGDGRVDIIVGVGADNRAEFSGTGQPGDRGGVYALDADGNELWYHQTEDSFGGPNGTPDGRPEGVYSAPLVFDLDADGVREVAFTSWDHYLYVLDGRDGTVEKRVNLHDTAGATPMVADLDNDGLYELVVPADISVNRAAGLPTQGGILHVLSNYGQANVAGWTSQVGTSTGADFRGKFEEQSLWSSPRIVDLDRDGTMEIVQGTGNYFQDERGQYVKVWNADGSLRHTLATEGRVLASPLIADLDGDGRMEIIAATLSGHVHAWDANGTALFTSKPLPYDTNLNATQNLPVVRQPIAVDLDADGDLEILISIASQVLVLDSDGRQLTNLSQSERSFGTYSGAPVARDIDGDGRIDIITGGTTASHDQAVIFRWENIVDTTATEHRTAAYQGSQSLHEVRSFVDRFYSTILGREADATGGNNWTDKLATGVQSGADVARGFIFSQEFQSRGTSDADYVNTLYAAFFGRSADTAGFTAWMNHLDAGASRAQVLDGFIGSREFANLANAYGIRPETEFGAASDAAVITGSADTDVLRGGSGDNTLYDQGSAVTESNADEKAISGRIYRLYGAALGRAPDATGFQNWFDGLAEGRITLQQAAGAFVNSTEFSNTYGALSDSAFVELLYQNVLNRPADTNGLSNWVGKLEEGSSRAEVLLGFSNSAEFQRRTNSGLDDFMRSCEPKWLDVLEGGAGDDTMNGGMGSDTFVFRAGQGGDDTIHGFEPWDVLQLSGFGFTSGADARARMTQQGANVLFRQGGQSITFLDTQLSEMSRVGYNVS